jgi:DNA-binding SARP family transcriptional activator
MHLWFEQALRAPGGADSREWGRVLNGVGSIAYMRGEVGRARELLEQAVTVLNRSGDRFREVMALGTLTNLLVSTGDHSKALECGERAATLARMLPDPWPLCHAMSNGLGYVHTRLGNHELAEACLREAHDKMLRSGGHDWGMAEVARARAALAIDDNRLDDARDHTLNALRAAIAIQRPHVAFRVLVVAERLMCGFGAFDAAARLHGSLAQARMTGFMPFPDDARHQVESLALLQGSLGEKRLQQVIGDCTAESLLATLARVSGELAAGHVGNISSDSRTIPASAPSNELRVQMLGRIEVIVSGTPVAADIWRQTRLIELIAYLLFHPEGRTREQVGVALWPEGSSAQVKNNFHVLLHKLRRQLGRPDAVIVNAEKYLLNPAMGIWFDAAIFKEDLTKALREPKRTDWRSLAAALDLYRGDLLDGMEIGDWGREEQDRLRDLRLNGLSALADRQMGAGDTAAAISTLQELARSDPQREDASRRLMKLLAAGGDIDAARAHYRWLVLRLRDEFDLAPESATSALGRELAQKT